MNTLTLSTVTTTYEFCNYSPQVSTSLPQSFHAPPKLAAKARYHVLDAPPSSQLSSKL